MSDYEDYGYNDNLFDDDDDEKNVPEQNDDDVLDSVIKNAEKKVGKVKRVVNRKPQWKLTEKELTGPKGLCALRDQFKNFKPNRAKSPYDNLNDVMQKMEYWAHLLYPRLTFDSVLEKVEVLGKKRATKVYLSKLRMGMPMFEEEDEKAPISEENQRDVFPTPQAKAQDGDDDFDDDIDDLFAAHVKAIESEANEFPDVLFDA